MDDDIHRFADPEYKEDVDDDRMDPGAIDHYDGLLREHVREIPLEVLEAAHTMPTRNQIWAMRHLAKRMGLSELELIELAIRLKRAHPKRSGAVLAGIPRAEIGCFFEITDAYEDLK